MVWLVPVGRQPRSHPPGGFVCPCSTPNTLRCQLQGPLDVDDLRVVLGAAECPLVVMTRPMASGAPTWRRLLRLRRRLQGSGLQSQDCSVSTETHRALNLHDLPPANEVRMAAQLSHTASDSWTYDGATDEARLSQTSALISNAFKMTPFPPFIPWVLGYVSWSLWIVG